MFYTNLRHKSIQILSVDLACKARSKSKLVLNLSHSLFDRRGSTFGSSEDEASVSTLGRIS